MATEPDPASRGAEAAQRAVELRKRGDAFPEGHPATSEDAERAEQGAREAREAAAHAASSAGQSLRRSADLHERVGEVDAETARQVPGATDVHEASADFHRRAAKRDRELAEGKRGEAQANES